MALTLRSDESIALQPWLEGVLVSMTILSLLATFIRTYSRRLNQQKLEWDDWFAILNMGWMLLSIAFLSAAVALGLGRHISEVDPKNVLTLVKVALTTDFLYIWGLVWSKLSVLLLYCRVFCFGYFKTATYAVGALVVILAIVSTLLTSLLCIPFEKIWLPDTPGHCLDETNVRIFNSASTIFTDIIILCLPAPQVWKLQLQKTERIAVIGIFALGSFVVFVAAYRISVFVHDGSPDKTYAIAPDAGWTIIELAAAIVSASLPAMGPAMIEFWFWINRNTRGCSGLFKGKLSGKADHTGGKATRSTLKDDSNIEIQTGPGEHGSFYRLASLTGQTNCEINCSVENGHESTSQNSLKKQDGNSVSESRDDGASDEVPLHAAQVRMSLSQTSTHIGR